MRRLLLISLAAAMSLFGCNDSGAPKLHTSVPPSTSVQDITTAQAQNICEGFQNLANDLVGPTRQQQIYCTTLGIAAEAGAAGTCESHYQDCLKGNPPTVSADFMCGLATGNAFSGCTATVGQVEDCVNAMSQAVDAALDGYNCTLASNSDALSTWEMQYQDATNGNNIAACQGLPSDCIPFIGDFLPSM